MIAPHRSVRSIETRPLVAPVLRPDILSRIRDLNLDYLALLAIERTDDAAGQLQFFAPKLRPAFAELALEQRTRLAAAPYALYSLRFEDARFWRTASNVAQPSIDDRYSGRTCASSVYEGFLEVALFQAWHIATTHPLAARMLYSMSEPVRESVAKLPLWQVRYIAAAHSKILAPRWPTNPCYWPDLISFARSGDSVRLAATQLLGTQLIGAELAAASASRAVTK